MSDMGDAAEDMVFHRISLSDQEDIPMLYADIASVNARISDDRRPLAVELVNVITGAQTMVASLAAGEEGQNPQYLLSARSSVYDVLAKDYPIYGLSNNNEISVQRMHEIYEENGLDWQRVFKKEFISSRMKMLKPSREIFDAAAAEIGLPPEEILFIDDSQTNVDGALAAGWQAGLYVQGTDLGACVKKFI